jgi:hypothetical protein
VWAPAARAADVLDGCRRPQEPAEEAAQDVGGPLRDQFLVRIDVATVMDSRGLLAAERLGVAERIDLGSGRSLSLALV